jgi:hypothetical protein
MKALNQWGRPWVESWLGQFLGEDPRETAERASQVRQWGHVFALKPFAHSFLHRQLSNLS